jgi:hypothetical protein
MVLKMGGAEGSKLFGDRQHIFYPIRKGGQNGLKREFLDITNLIRSIQRAEGNPDCFGKAKGDCDQPACSWRRYCLQEEAACPERDD